MSLRIDAEKVAEILDRVTNSPTTQHLELLVQDYAIMGYYAAQAEGDADYAEAQRKYAEAEAFDGFKRDDPKATAAWLEAQTKLATFDAMKAEIKARTNARKLINLQRSVEQAINAVKFLGRETGVRMGP